MSASGQPLTQHLVVIVHGVGDPQPGDTLREFWRGSQAAASLGGQVHEGVTWLHDESSGARKLHSFPVHHRVVETATQRQVFAEVFWGDVSRVRGGKLGVLRGILDVLFGLRHVAYEAADQHGRAARSLRSLSAITAGMIRGPFAALNAMLMVLWALAALLVVIAPHSSHQGPPTNLCVMLVAAVTLVTAAAFGKNRRGHILGDLARWTAFWAFDVLCLSVALAVSYAQGLNIPGTLNVVMWHTMILLRVLGTVWLLQTAIVLTMFACWLLARCDRRNHPAGLDAALLVTVLTVGLWGQIVPTAWRVAYLLVQKVGLLPQDLGEQFQAIFERSVPMMGMQWLMATCVVLVFFLVSLRHTRWRRRASAALYDKHRPAPRLLVHRGVQITAAVCAIMGSSTAVFITVWDIFGWPWQQTQFGNLLVHGNTIALSAAGLVGMAALSTLNYLRIGIDIVFDVVTHFYRSPGSDAARPSADALFPYRDQLCRRAANVVRHFHDPHARSRTLTLITHSQGTMVGAGLLNSTDLDVPWHAFDSISFVTMGSPLRHLYQQYFAHRYPPLNSPFWQPLRNRVRLWVNIFRIDDFVGTYLLDPGTECTEWDEMVLVDHPVDPLGHTEYWIDRQVIAALRAYCVLPPVPQVQESSPFEYDQMRRAA